MLNPNLIVDAVVKQLLLIDGLVTAMSPEADPRISGFYYRMGSEPGLAKAVYEMPAPSILVAWEGTAGGNFDGETIWKHRVGVYLRMANSAGNVANDYADLWWTLVNEAPKGSSTNIRYVNFLPQLDIMDTPSIMHQLDQDSVDLFRAEFILPEIGDN